MEQKKNEYNKTLNNLKSIENVCEMNEEKYDKRINEIHNIIKTIQSNRKNYTKRMGKNTQLSKDLNDMYINNNEKRKQIHNNGNTIKELLKKLTENTKF
jgi:SMC interacting uncharacterized protein involved in chromosome segregation